MIIKTVRDIGHSTILWIESVGRFVIFFMNAIVLAFSRPFYLKSLFINLFDVGIRSLPLIAMTAFFTGAVLALQSYTGFSRMHAESAIASVVVLSITRELGPVLAGLMLAGRLSASIAAEIGTMKVTEQIDALYTLDVNPLRYLVTPRIVAGMLALPFLVIIADIIGVFGGYMVGVHKLGFEPALYIQSTVKFLKFSDVTSGLIKAVFFGMTVCTFGCYYGYNAPKGAQGVGIATTKAVVMSSIIILCLNYIITGILFSE